MFKPVSNEHTTDILGAPKDWDEELDGKCIGLPVYYFKGEFYSWWEVSWKDRIKILFGSPIRLAVFSQTHPPVSLDTRND